MRDLILSSFGIVNGLTLDR